MEKPGIFTTSFAGVYPHYIHKAEKKGRTKEEVDAIICWLTGYPQQELQQQIANKIDFETFLKRRYNYIQTCRRSRVLFAVTAWKRSKTSLCKRSGIWINWLTNWPKEEKWKKS